MKTSSTENNPWIRLINTLNFAPTFSKTLDNLDSARHDHQKNKSDIVNLVKQMFAQEKWGDEKYRKALEELAKKDTELVAEVTRIIKENHSKG
jgi:hypothetical protein